MSVLQQSVLILNRNWQVDSFTTVEDAIVAVFRDRATILDTRDYLLMSFEEWASYDPPNDYDWIKTPTTQVPAPQIIALKFYGERPPRKLSFSKPAVFHRDNHKCIFCGIQLPAVKLTLEHVLPRSRGGGTNFLNCATACAPCNAKKADKLPEEAGMPLRYPLFVPDWMTTARVRVPNNGVFKESWRPFLERDGITVPVN